jgi:hypothetical protein
MVPASPPVILTFLYALAAPADHRAVEPYWHPHPRWRQLRGLPLLRPGVFDGLLLVDVRSYC